MTQRIRIALVLSYSYSYYRDLARGVRLYAETRPHWYFASASPDVRPLPTAGPLRPDGIIAAINTDALATALAAWRGPLVNVSAVLPDPPLPRVGVDNVAVGRVAAEHFLDRGLRNFGFIGPKLWGYSVAREAGFRAAVEAAGHRAASYHDPAGPSFDPSARDWPLDRRVHKWLLALPKPVGLFCVDDLWGMQMSEACRQTGLRVPDDVALLGAENDDLHCELARPTLSSVHIDAHQIGRRAAALLDQLLGGAKRPRRPELLPPHPVVVRRSTDVLALDDPDVVTAVRFIRENGAVPLRVEDVSSEVAIGRRSLERRFRQALGRGIGEEIRRAHLERAKRLLAETDLPMGPVAEQSGFANFRHMAVVFRKELGLSPTGYRANVRCPG